MIWAGVLLLAVVTGIMVWNRWFSATRIAFVNYQATTLGQIARANGHARIRLASVEPSEFGQLGRYDVVLMNGMGLRITAEERAALQHAADRGLTVTAYPVFLYGEDRVAPGEPVPPDLLRDARTENRAKRLLETYLEPESGKPGHYSISGEEALFRELLPEFRMPPDLLARTEQRSLIFFAPAGIPFALCLLLTLVSATVLPQLTVTLLIPTFFFGALLAGAAAGYRREGRMTLRRQQGLYLHCICVFHPDVCLTAAQSPWAASVGRTNLTLTFPGWVKLKVRSVPLRDAEKFFRFMETN